MTVKVVGAALGVALYASVPATAAINLEFRAASPVYSVGDTVEFGLFAVSDSSSTQSLSAAEVIFAWDTSFLSFVGLDGSGGAGLALADFMTVGSGGLNETNPPADGDGLFFGFANLGSPIDATPGGTLLTTFQFDALAETPATMLDILAAGGTPVRSTIVYDGVQPNTDVTGTLTGDAVEIVPAPGAGASFIIACLAASRRRR
ncbi:MAG: hypothetical protein RIB32_01565 [Phycisphaerales bacterium]